MSTLKTDIIKDVAETVSINVTSISTDPTLRQDLAATGGASLVGYSGRTVADQLSDEISVKAEGALGNGIANDLVAFKAAFAKLTDNSSLYIPEGTYVLDIVDVDLIDIGFNVDFTPLMVVGLTNVTIKCDGEVFVKCGGSTKRVFTMCFKDCTNVQAKLNLRGELNPQDNVPNSETGVAMGIILYNSTGRLTNGTYKKLIVPFSVTGQPKSPATVADVSSRVVISGNVFDTFEQNSTFGAGANEFIIHDNNFIDMYAGIKISQNPFNDPSAYGVSGRIIIHDNTFTWRNTFAFADVFFDPTKCESPYGIQLQSAAKNIDIHDNIIDMTNCRAFTKTPISNPAPIIIFSGAGAIVTVDQLQTENINIHDNTLISNPHVSGYAITSTANVRNLSIYNNPKVVGGIQVLTGGPTGFNYGTLAIRGNHVVNNGTLLAATISVGAGGNYDLVDIADNVMQGSAGTLVLGDRELIFLTGFTTGRLSVRNNVLPNGRISNYGSPRFTVVKLSVVGNGCKGVDLLTTNLTRASIRDNSVITDGPAYKLDLDAGTKASARVYVTGNDCSGDTVTNSGGALTLNGGTVYLNGNSFGASTGTAFVLDVSVTIFSGSYFGNGAPSAVALFGVTYVDFALGSNATYLKTTPSGSTGWKLIATVP